MDFLFSLYANYYYIILGLQAICAIHCIRKGNQSKWIWIIVFLPLIGCIAYIFTEIITKRDIQNVQSEVGTVFNQSGRIKKLQANLRFTDTFQNRIALADAYLDNKEIDKAIELYESCIAGTFVDNEYGNIRLMLAYYEKKRFADVVRTAKKISNLSQFARSRAHVVYAISLGHTDDVESAKKEFQLLNSRFSNYECRYEYGMFLLRNKNTAEAKSIFNTMVDEESHMSFKEKRANRVWFANAKEELKKI